MPGESALCHIRRKIVMSVAELDLSTARILDDAFMIFDEDFQTVCADGVTIWDKF